MKISLEQKVTLLELARTSISNLFDKKSYPEIDDDDTLFNSKCGVFVTLTKKNKLRGCIGYITSDEPLKETIKEAAELAAVRDPRFSPLSKNEFNEISIEVSILSEPFPLNSYDEIEVGKHGLILEESGYRGLLLPQVPIEHNLNKDQYLSALCNKAGLPADYWRVKEIKLKAFTATVFSEKEIGTENE